MEKKINVVRSHAFMAQHEEVTLKVTDRPTNYMMLRAYRDGGIRCGSFVCGIDASNGWLYSTIGICGRTYEDFVYNVCKYYHHIDSDIAKATEFRIIDDPIYDDIPNEPLTAEQHVKFCR